MQVASPPKTKMVSIVDDHGNITLRLEDDVTGDLLAQATGTDLSEVHADFKEQVTDYIRGYFSASDPAPAEEVPAT